MLEAGEAVDGALVGGCGRHLFQSFMLSCAGVPDEYDGEVTVRMLEGWADPASLFREVEKRDPCVFWLDAGAGARSGWSFLGAGDPAGEPAALPLAIDAATQDPRVPPFRGGWVGWLDYETGARGAGAPGADAESGAWMHVTRLLAFDHERQCVWVVAPEAEIDAWAAAASDLIAAAAPVAAPPVPESLVASARDTPSVYAGLVEQCRDLIRLGEAYQLCLTTRFDIAGPLDPIVTYLRLRAATPAHHGGFVRIGERALLSASPEQFLRAEAGRIVTRPIKGTRPRGADAASDNALAADLAASPKERAENVMIVDLMRNDLSRVCEPGTIRVEALFAVESYPAVHQLVSTVSGHAVPGTTVGELWAATFPPGSMTGAPKLSAMTHLHALEQGPRGVYSGCFGYVGDDGAVDLAVIIRSIVIGPHGAYVGAGGGITWGSDAAAEVAEVAIKARAPLAAAGAALPPEWERMR